MKRFLTGMAIGALIVSGGWLLFWVGQLGRPHPNNAWIDEAIVYKQSLARRADSPKIVVVAGSSAMFGIDSGLLEATYLRPTINLGVNAGISLPVILAKAAPVIEAGDLVVLPLEYPLYNRDEAVSSALVHWVNSHTDALVELPWERVLAVMVKTSLTRVLEGYRGLPEAFTVSGDYGVQNLDERGDQKNTARALREARHWNFLTSLPAETYGRAARKGRPDWSRLRAFRDEVLAKGACPIFTAPPLLDQPSYHEAPEEAWFYNTLPERANAAGLMWLGSPYAAMREADDFFDTNFHLVDEARTQYTRLLIGWLGSTPFEQCRRHYAQRS